MIEPATEVPLCAPCVNREGLCVWHAEHDRLTRDGNGLMPLLAQEAWHQNAHRGENDRDVAPKVSREAAKAQRREERKAQRARERATNRLLNELDGGPFTRSRRKVA